MAQTYKTGLIITGDASGGIRAIKATEDELGKLNQRFDRGSRRSKQFNQSVNATSQGLAALRRAAAPIAGAIAGMFAANTLQGQINWADQLQKTNLRIGASTEALSQYNYVASLSGVEFNQLTTAWQRQTRRIAEAAAGTGVAVAALDRLNLSAQELNQLAPEDQFERIAEAMQGVESSSERVRLAQQLWDSEGVKLVQIVNSGTEAIEAMRGEADALGLTITQQTANAMAGYNDEVDRLKFAAQGVSQTIAGALIPSLTSGLQATNRFISALRSGELEDTERVLRTTAGAATGVAAAVGTAAVAYGGYSVAAWAAHAAQVAVNRAMAANPFILAATAVAGLAGALYASRDATIEMGDTNARVQDWLRASWQETAGQVSGAMLAAYEESGDASSSFLGQAVAVSDGVWETHRALMGNMASITHSSVNSIIAYFHTIGDVMAIVGSSIWQQFRDAFSNTLRIAGGFWQDLQAIFDGDLSFSNFKNAMTAAIQAPLEGMAGEIRAAFDENFNRNYLGELETAITAPFSSLGESISDTAFRMRFLRNDSGVVAEGFSDVRTESGKTNSALQEFLDTLDDSTGATSTTAAAAREAAKQTTSLANSYENLLDRIQPNRRAARQYAQDVGTLNLALATGRINAVQYMQAMGMLQESFQAAQRETDNLATASEDASQRIANSFLSWETVADNTLRRIDDSGQSLWLGLIDGSESALDTVKRGFQQTLAEIAHMLTTQRLTFHVAGMMGLDTTGMPGGGSGGFNLGSMGSLYNSATRLPYIGDAISSAGSALGFGGSSAAAGGLYANALTGSAAAGGLYAGASTGAAVGGLYGNALTGAATTAGGGFMSAASAAMPWLAGGMLVDNVLGLGIVDGIVGGISDIFGGGKSDPRLNISTRGDAGQFSHESVRTGAFGAVGFSEGTKRSNDLFGSVEAEREWLASVAALDNLTAAAARTPEQLDAMTSAVQNMVLTSGDAQGAIDQLAGRTAAATRVLDAELTQTLLDAGASAEQIAQRFATARNAVDLITAASERLNLQYDANADGALRYADSLVQAYGSVESITAIQDAYYNAAFSDQERLQNQYDDVRSALNGLTDEAPRTVAELRALVEAQQLNGGASQQLAYDLMALAPALAETNAAVRRAIEQQYQESLGRAPEAAGLEYWFNQVASGSATLERALSAIAASSEAAQYAAGDTAESIDLATAAREYERDALAAANRVQQERVRAIEQEARAMMSAGGNIRQFVESLQNTAGAGLSPETAYQNAEESFLAAISTIYTSDDSSLVQDTISGITGIAQEYLAAAEAYGASGSIYQQAQALVEGSLDDLAGRLGSDELEDIDPQLQAMVDQLKNVAANTGLAGPLAKQVPLAQTFSEFFGGSGSQNYMYRQLGALAGIEAAIRDTAAKAVEESTPQGRTLSVSQAAAALRGSGNSQLASLFNSSKTVAQHAGNLEYNLGGLLNGESRGLVDTVTARTIANALDFDESRYFTLNEDVAAAVARGEFASGLQHFVSHGLQEGRKFAKGGVFTNSIVSSPTLFDMGLMGESGDEAIMPLTRHRNGSLGVRAELPPMPQFPALGRSDVLQVLQDVRRELVETRQQNQRLQEENNQHAAAAVAVQQEGFRQQISEQKKGNDALGAMASKARLEGSR